MDMLGECRKIDCQERSPDVLPKDGERTIQSCNNEGNTTAEHTGGSVYGPKNMKNGHRKTIFAVNR